MDRQNDGNPNKPKIKSIRNSQALRNPQSSEAASSKDILKQPDSPAVLFGDKEVGQSSLDQVKNSKSSPKRNSYLGNHTASDQNSANDDSEGDDCLRKSVLPVAKFNSYDENVPPKSGEEYLRRVQYVELLIRTCDNQNSVNLFMN